MCKNWRGGFICGVIVAMLAWGLVSAVGVLCRNANAQDKGVPSVEIDPRVGRLTGEPSPMPATKVAARPKGITELIEELSAIRARKEELAKAEKETLAALRLSLKQLEKKLSELGVEIVESPVPNADAPREQAKDTTVAPGTGAVPSPPLPRDAADKRP